MNNPWLHLPNRPPYVLREERVQVEWFNRNHNAHEALRVRTDLLPEPFLGARNAPVVLLLLNPGFHPEDPAAHALPGFRRRVLQCIHGEGAEYPLFHLEPALPGPGPRWWTRTLRRLIDDCGRSTVARRLLCVEFFPYHTSRFGHADLRLASQQYSFSLVRQAIARSAIVILARGKRLWLGAVPELINYRRLAELRSVRSAALSRRNLGRWYSPVRQAIANVSNREDR